MLRNIDKMRATGIMAQPEWLNKDVLMVEEAIRSSVQDRADTPGLSPGSANGDDRASAAAHTTIDQRSKRQSYFDDSIFNIELGQIVQTRELLMSQAYQKKHEPNTASPSSNVRSPVAKNR